jgi:peptidyl-tRNA hydrolase
MNYSKDKKEFEKFVEENDMGYFPSLEYGIDREDAEKLWSWIVSKFQSHDRKMLEWVRDKVIEELVMMTHDHPNTADIEYCQGFRDAKEKTIEFLRQLINQKLKEGK